MKQNGKPKPLKGGLGGTPSGPLIPEVVQDGTIDPRTPGKDLRLIGAAVRHRWEIQDLAFSALPNALLRLALDPKKEDRARVNAARVVVTMHGQNEPPPENSVNVGITIDQPTIRDALHEPDYLDYLERLRDAGPVCVNGDAGAVPVPAAHSGHQPGHSGHHNGNGNGHVNGHTNGKAGSNGHAAH